jgi:molecular chaperone GrpE
MTVMNDNDAARKDQEPSPTANSGAAPGEPDRELGALRTERDQLQEQLKRTLADMANVRRRHQKEMEQARGAAIEALAGELLPVLDGFHMALDSHDHHEGASDNGAALAQGLRMVRSLLEGALERHGLREIKSGGEPFNPNLHEAVGLDAIAEVAPGHIARVLQRGYYLGEKVLRPSRVLVRDQRAASEGEARKAD